MARRSTPVSFSIEYWLLVICREVWASRAKQESKDSLRRMKWLQTETSDKLGLKQEFRSQAADSGHYPKENVTAANFQLRVSLLSWACSEVLRRCAGEGDRAEKGGGSRACQILGVMGLKGTDCAFISARFSWTPPSVGFEVLIAQRLLSIPQEKSQKWDFQLYKRDLSVKLNYQTHVLWRLLFIQEIQI